MAEDGRAHAEQNSAAATLPERECLDYALCANRDSREENTVSSIREFLFSWSGVILVVVVAIGLIAIVYRFSRSKTPGG
jgi:hypothetical protein